MATTTSVPAPGRPRPVRDPGSLTTAGTPAGRVRRGHPVGWRPALRLPSAGRYAGQHRSDQV